MRTWYVPLEILDDNRLVAQHREIHAIIGSIESPLRGYQHHPAVKAFNNDHFICLLEFHEETTWAMRKRGWFGHKTPIIGEQWVEAAKRTSPWLPKCPSWRGHVAMAVTDVEIQKDIHDLIERWTNEGKQLRNNLAYVTVGQHRLNCSADCAMRAFHLRSWRDDRLERPNELVHIPGNSSMKGRIE